MCQLINRHRIVFSVIGALLVIGAFILYFVSDTVVEKIVKKKLVLSEDSMAYDLWKNVPADITYDMYLYNLTNGHDVANFGATPVVKEVGPYTFRQHRQKENITFLTSNGTVTYLQRVYYIFDEDLSHGVSLDDQIVHFNYAIVSASSVLSTFPNQTQNVYLDMLNNICTDKVMNVDCGLVQQHNVLELLFEGYPDKFLQAAAWVAPTPGSRFALLLNHNDSTQDGYYDIFTGAGDHGMDKFGLLDLYKGKPTLGYFKDGSICDQLSQSTPGDLRPPYVMTHNDDPVYLLYADLCRHFRLDYYDKREVLNLKCKRYVADERLFDYEAFGGENKCYCKDDKPCPQKGLCDISHCYWNAPIFLSYPYFFNGDQNLTKDVQYVDGINPKKSQYPFYIDFEPTLGIPIVVNAELQINLKALRDDRFPALKVLKQDISWIPVAWFRLHVELGDGPLSKIKLVANVVPLVVLIVSILLLVSGLLFLICTGYYKFCAKHDYRKSK